MHRRLFYIYLLNVPSFSSRYFNKIKLTSRLGRLLALSLDILSYMDCFHQTRLSSNMGFVLGTITKMAVKMATACKFALVDTLPLSFNTRLLPNFKYGLLLSNSHPSFNMGFVQ